jgi:glycosyltransferase involved in cell wall biosynthesis
MRVSVLMTAYNAERFLPAAVESVLRQTHRDFELVIVDDGSTDGTPHLLRRYAGRDGRLRVLTHANMGMGRSLNEALDTLETEWVARLDADDEMLPDRLERQLAFVARHPDLSVAATLVNYVNASGRAVGWSFSRLVTPRAVAEAVRAGELIHVHHSSVMARVGALRAVGGFRPQFWPADDVDLWNRLAERGHGVLVQPEYLTNYRIHGGSACVASARRAARKLEWVHACARSRRAGYPEPTWAQFLDEAGERSLVGRLNQTRREVGRANYKAATVRFADRQYLRCAVHLSTAAALEPAYVTRKVLPQIAARVRSPLRAGGAGADNTVAADAMDLVPSPLAGEGAASCRY